MAYPVLNPDWITGNSQRRYPISADTDVTDTSGSFVIPNSFLLELDFSVHTGHDVDPGKFYLKHLGSWAGGYSLILGYSGDEEVNVATALIPRHTHLAPQSYALAGIGDFSDSIGKVTIGDLEEIDQQPSGFWGFELESTRLETDAIRPMLRGVSSLTVVNGTSRSEPLTGDIELVAGANFQLVPILASGEDPQIQLSALSGEGLIADCLCEGDVTAVPIKRINGVPPTALGDFTLLGNECLLVETIPFGLRLNDRCSSPCCGCHELEVISDKLQELLAQKTTLVNFLNRLEGVSAQLATNVLGTKLSDRACFGDD